LFTVFQEISMRVTAMQEYGLRCMIQLVDHRSERPLAVREIASREKLTPVYVEKILVGLRRAGLVKSIRGVNGGYALSRPAEEISVASVLSALGQVDLGRNLCKRFTGDSQSCVHNSDCGIRPIWSVLTRYIFDFLNQISLAQLVKEESQVAQTVDRLSMKLPSRITATAKI
jgi:Rrf2 family protein